MQALWPSQLGAGNRPVRVETADCRISLPDCCCFSLLDAISMPKVSYRSVRSGYQAYDRDLFALLISVPHDFTRVFEKLLTVSSSN
jgi:hypothetical protein